jgi:hypothetical protein
MFVIVTLQNKLWNWLLISKEFHYLKSHKSLRNIILARMAPDVNEMFASI